MSEETDIKGIPGLEDLEVACPPEKTAEAKPRLASEQVPLLRQGLDAVPDERQFHRNGEGERPLLNPTEPQYRNQREKYEHRIIAYLKAAGNSNMEVARITGYSNITINYLVRQPWMEQTILEEIHKLGDEAMQTLHQASAEAAVSLVEIARSAENLETKRKACNDILDRKYGKPNQPYSMKDVRPEDASDAELLAVVKAAQEKN